mgnify:CR=1 FL=1
MKTTALTRERATTEATQDGSKRPPEVNSQDEELTRLRAEAGAIVETATNTPITDSAFINYPKTLNLDRKGG